MIHQVTCITRVDVEVIVMSLRADQNGKHQCVKYRGALGDEPMRRPESLKAKFSIVVILVSVLVHPFVISLNVHNVQRQVVLCPSLSFCAGQGF